MGKEKARLSPCPVSIWGKLLFLVGALGWLRRCAFGLGLRFGLFHRLLGFGSLLGTGFGALFALLVENLLAAQQFEECLVGAVTLIPGRTDDAGVSAVAVAEARSDGVEQLHDGLAGHQVGSGLTTRGKITALAERDHLLDQ